MKFHCGPSPEKVALLSEWHPVFLWWPKRIGVGDCRWLETVERKGRYYPPPGYSFWHWDYRAPAAQQEAA